MPVHYLAGDTEAYAAAIGFRGEERHENLLLHVGRNWSTVIRDTDMGLPRIVDVSADIHVPGASLNGILD